MNKIIVRKETMTKLQPVDLSKTCYNIQIMKEVLRNKYGYVLNDSIINDSKKFLFTKVVFNSTNGFIDEEIREYYAYMKQIENVEEEDD